MRFVFQTGSIKTYKHRGLCLQVSDDTLFEFPDDSDLLSVTGTFNVLRPIKNGKFAKCTQFQKKKMALCILMRAARIANKIIQDTKHEHN